MAELNEILFGEFTTSEVLALYRLESSGLEFGWQRKKNCVQHIPHLTTPDKISTRCRNLGGASPNIPRNPPTTPISELNSRGASPSFVPQSTLNANAPPFIPGSSPRHGNEIGSSTEEALLSVRSALEQSLTTPTHQPHPVGSEFTTDSSTPVQTVGVVTPPLLSVTEGEITSSDVRPDSPPIPHHQSPSSHPHTVTSSTGGTITDQRPKSWASIVMKSGSGSEATPTSVTPLQAVRGVAGEKSRELESSEMASDTTASADPVPSTHLISLGEQLERLCVTHSPISLQPRGLINQGNWCYMHAPLQALISLPEIVHLLRHLNPDPPLSVAPSNTPLTDTLTQFIHNFSEYQSPPVSSPVVKGKKRRPATDFVPGAPFRPDDVYDLLHKIDTSLSTKGRQEDAEEFLGHVLGGLHEEMVAALRAVGRGKGEREESVEPSEPGEGGEEGEWEQVGPKNKSTITRQMLFSESVVSEVFGGELRCVLQRQGAKESATVEPFFSLQLDIQANEVWSVQDAVVGLAMKEAVQMNSGTHNEVDAHRRQSLARLPVVLLLHLKRFVFDKTGGSQKLMKQVSYKMDLELSRDLLAPSLRNKVSNSQRFYKLWAVVYHHGKSAVGGHYTCDVRHTGSGGWLRIDDSLVKPVPEEAVLWQSQNSNKVAYLLFYRRTDCVTTP